MFTSNHCYCANAMGVVQTTDCRNIVWCADLRPATDVISYAPCIDPSYTNRVCPLGWGTQGTGDGQCYRGTRYQSTTTTAIIAGSQHGEPVIGHRLPLRLPPPTDSCIDNQHSKSQPIQDANNSSMIAVLNP